MAARSKQRAKRRSSKRPPWAQANPKPRSTGKKLSAAAKAMARARAKKAGRRYPNLVDNMWAARAVRS